MSILEPLFEALNLARVRYVVVGGVAVVLHGYARLTNDLDLAVDLAPQEAGKAIDTLTQFGLRPQAAVKAGDFSDPAQRERWVLEKRLVVFSLWDPSNPMRVVDLFVQNPIPFDDLWNRSELVQLDNTSVRIAAIPDLIALKRLAGRERDREDIEALELILQARARGGDDE